MAFEALEAFPALAESRNRLLSVIAKDHVATADIVSAVESDVALIIAVLRMANRVEDGRGRIDTAVAAVELLRPETVHTLAGRLRTFDFFERASMWDAARSASACTPSRHSTPPIALPRRSATRTATA